MMYRVYLETCGLADVEFVPVEAPNRWEAARRAYEMVDPDIWNVKRIEEESAK